MDQGSLMFPQNHQIYGFISQAKGEELESISVLHI